MLRKLGGRSRKFSAFQSELWIFTSAIRDPTRGSRGSEVASEDDLVWNRAANRLHCESWILEDIENFALWIRQKREAKVIQGTLLIYINCNNNNAQMSWK